MMTLNLYHASLRLYIALRRAFHEQITATARPFASASAAATRLRPVEWLICAVAALGFAFDLYEVLVLPLVLRPALASLGPFAPGDPAFDHWVACCSTSPR